MTTSTTFARPARPSTSQQVGNGIRARGVRSECAACGEVFAGVGPFDAHRIGPHAEEFAPGRFRKHPDRRCLTADELAARFSRDGRGYWTAP